MFGPEPSAPMGRRRVSNVRYAGVGVTVLQRESGRSVPQRIIVNSRPSGALRITGADVSGQISGRDGRLPVLSSQTLIRSVMAAWPFG